MKKIFSTLLACVVSFSVLVGFTQQASAGTIQLYEGNGGQQDLVDRPFPDRPDFSGKVKPNDEARSLKLNDVRPFTKVAVYDDPDGGKGDDYTTISVKKPTPTGLVVGSFEGDFENEYIKVVHNHKNGLDGKVSYITIEGFDF